MAGPRNPNGVNDSSDCYRTIADVRWGGNPYPGADLVRTFRAAGVRCRKFGDDLFIHPEDYELATQLEASYQAGLHTTPSAALQR